MSKQNSKNGKLEHKAVFSNSQLLEGEDIITDDSPMSPHKHTSLFEDDVKIEKKPQMYQGESILQGKDVLEQENDEGNIEYKWKLVNVSPDRFKHLVSQMNFRLSEGQGEAIYEIGITDDGIPVGLTDEEFKETYDTLKKMAADINADVSIICEKLVEDKKNKKEKKRVAEVLVRLFEDEKYLDLRIAVCGNVDSGKSTLIGVLTKGKLDNGRGLARMNVFNHKHEVTTGRTSSISHQIMGFDSKGTIVNYSENEIQGSLSWKQIIDKSSKVITFIDLAGHEKYLKTTVFGMTGSVPDYALIVIGANMGVTRMTKEHIGLCIALKLPMIFIVTKIDICPENILKETLNSINKILKLPGVRKLPYMIKNEDDVITCSKNVVSDRISPIFLVSHVTGENLDLLKQFLNLVPLRKDWESQIDKKSEYFIDQTFYVTGVGTVVSGIVTQGTISVNDTLTLGPDGNGQWKKVQIKGIHCKRNQVKSVHAGQTASLALRKEKRSNIRKGMVMVEDEHPDAVWEFAAEVIVLYHSTTISSNYQPVIHCIVKDTPITLHDGTAKPIQNIEIGDIVSTCNTDNGKREFQQVLNVMNQGIKECFEMVLLDGTKLSCTGDHKILIYDKRESKLEWKETKDIEIGDLIIKEDIPILRESPIYKENGLPILTKKMLSDFGRINDFPRQLPITENDVEVCKSLARLLGSILTDGNLSYDNRWDTLRGVIYVGQIEDVNEVSKDIISLGFDIPTYSQMENVYSVSLPSPLPYVLHALGAPVGRKTSQKTLFPNWLLNAPNYIIYEFLCGFLGGDGLIPTMRDTGIQHSVGACRSSEIKYKESFVDFMDKLCILFEKIGFKKPKQNYYLYIQLGMNNSNFEISSKEFQDPLNVTEDNIKMKFPKISENGRIMIKSRIYLQLADMKKFEKEMSFVYCLQKQREFRQRISYENMKNHLLSKKKEIFKEIIELWETGEETQSNSLELIKKKYDNNVFYNSLIPKTSNKIFQKEGGMNKIFQRNIFKWKTLSNGNHENVSKKQKIDVMYWNDIIDVGLNDFIGVPFAEKNHIGKKSVYDLSIDNNHNFVASSIVVHNCMCVRQCAKIISLFDKDSLRTGDKAKVKFRFMFRPEYIKPGERLIFREGRTKGLGVITEILTTCEDEIKQKKIDLEKKKLPNPNDVKK